MIIVNIPGYKNINIQHLVLDYNGTIAVDGQIISGVKEILNQLGNKIQVHVLTADTFGQCASQLKGVSCDLSILPLENQDIAKHDYVRDLGFETSVCIGNGRNDWRMLKEAALGIAVILGEGAAVETLMAADIVCTDILSALELLTNPLRLTATLRS